MMQPIRLIFILQVLSHGSNETILWTTHYGALYSEAVVGARDLTDRRADSIKRLASPEIRIGTFTAYEKHDDWLRSKGYGGTDCNYENWYAELERRQFTSRPARCPTLFQAIKFSDTIVLRRIDGNCLSSVEVLEGKDNSLTFQLSGARYEILDIIVHQRVTESTTTRRREPQVSIYVRSDLPATIGRAKTLLHFFVSLSGTSNVTVHLRNDQWFVMHCEFPVPYLFGGIPQHIPTRAEFEASKEATCVASLKWPIQCF